jgi:glycosyltransferase involved in cell wall biosynthesis
MRDRLTVVVTTFNHERFIRTALDSVLQQQTRDPFKILVIDDCSSDDTGRILQDYRAQHPDRLHVLTSAVNTCDNVLFLEALQGISTEYVAFLDGDDYWLTSRKLQAQIDYLDAHPRCTVCFHDVLLVDKGGIGTKRRQPADQPETSTLDDLLEWCFVTYSAAMLRTAATRALPPTYRNDTSADWSLFVAAARHGEIGYINQALGVYREHAGGFWSGAPATLQRERVIQFYLDMLAFLPDHRAQVVRLLLGQYLQLAFEYARLNDLDRARECYGRALELEPDPRKFRWTLRTAAGAAARLSFPRDDRHAVRVVIARAGTQHLYDIQLNVGWLSVRKDRVYGVRFEARADRARCITVGYARAYEPWDNLGLYETLALTNVWQSFAIDFAASADETNGRVHFDLGASDSSVELKAIAVVPVGHEHPVEPAFMGAS